MSFQIVNLKDYPKLLKVRAAWSFSEWGCLEEEATLEKYIEYSQDVETSKPLPQCWFAISSPEGKPMGMISLKETEHPDRQDISPWLGGLYVHPAFRGKGIAQNLCRFLEEEANKYDYSKIYLQTLAPNFYMKMGWVSIGTVRDMSGLHPEGETLMVKNL